MAIKKKKINNGKKKAVSNVFNVKKNKRIFLSKLEHIEKKEVSKKKINFKKINKLDLHPIGGGGEVLSIKYKVLSKHCIDDKKLGIKGLGISCQGLGKAGKREKSGKVSSIKYKVSSDRKFWEVENHKSAIKSLSRVVSRDQKSEWVILDSSNGEEFALRKCVAVASGNTAEDNRACLRRQACLRCNSKNIDRSIMGLPEAGKNTPWNLIEVKEVLKSGCEDEKYILDDYDVLQKTEDFSANLNYSVRSYNSSPYVVDLKKKDDGIETKKVVKVSPFLLFKNIYNNIFFKTDKISSVIQKASSVNEEMNARKECDENISDVAAHSIKSNFVESFFENFQESSIKNFLFSPVRVLKDGCNKVFSQDYFYSKILSFVVIAFLIVSPIYGLKQYLKVKEIQGKVLGASVSAIDNLKLGKDLMQVNDFYAAKENFNKAEDDFKSASRALNEINNLSYKIAFLVFNKDAEVKSAEALIEAGERASEVSSILADSFKKISSSFDGLVAQEASSSAAFISDASSSEDGNTSSDIKNNFSGRNFSNLVSDFHNTLEMTLPKIHEIKEDLKIVDEGVLPEQDRDNFNKVKNLLVFVDNKMNFYEDAVYVLDKFFAKNSAKRYLLVFQNNNEVRPTGGFIGSYSLIDIEDGKIVNIETPSEGSYYLEGSLLENIKPPYPLRLINGRWEFQDANWWPDFPQSAKFISELYEKSGGRTVDGVIAINAGMMVDLLNIIGPIEMPEYNKVIESSNFIEETQKAVELEYDRKENEPKKIITDLMPRVMGKMFSAEREKFLDILSVLSGDLRDRDIQIYFKDEDLEAKTVELGWAGEIKDIKNRDYLEIVDTNIGGKKTDAVIEQNIEHNTNVSDDGTIIDELIIHKKHNGVKGDYFYGVNNVDYLRVYVPQGSVLLSAEGFDAPPESCFKELADNIIEDEFLANIEAKEKIHIESGTRIGENFGKTYFANWTQVDPGEEVTVKLSYKLPFKIFDCGTFSSSISGGEQIGKYSLYIQKQSGSHEWDIIKNIKLPENLTPIWAYPGTPENGEWVKFDKLDSDKFYGAIVTGK